MFHIYTRLPMMFMPIQQGRSNMPHTIPPQRRMAYACAFPHVQAIHVDIIKGSAMETQGNRATTSARRACQHAKIVSHVRHCWPKIDYILHIRYNSIHTHTAAAPMETQGNRVNPWCTTCTPTHENSWPC